ncbi:MAG TPA: universal stress protein [Pyrinomonadaceae bacterium]
MKILLATDGSPCSEAAIKEVAQRPWPADTQVRVVSIVETPAPLVADPHLIASSYFEETEKICRRQAEDAVKLAAAKLGSGQSGDPLVSTQVLKGSPKRTIVEEAEAWDADLIVVGSHGYRSWERMLLGSVSQAVAAHAKCSVEIVRKKTEVRG